MLVSARSLNISLQIGLQRKDVMSCIEEDFSVCICGLLDRMRAIGGSTLIVFLLKRLGRGSTVSGSLGGT